MMTGLRIDHIQRRGRLQVSVNGRPITAFRGESVLAALVASGYLILRRSHKLKEGRGALCGVGVCYECLVSINGLPNQRACMVEVEDGMEIEIDEA